MKTLLPLTFSVETPNGEFPKSNPSNFFPPLSPTRILSYPENLNEDALIKETLKSWMDGIQKQKQQYAIGLSVRVTHCRPSPVAL